MRVCEVAVVGLGLIGSSAFHSLVRRRADVLGFDPLVLGEARGSSHGSCRVYRRFNFESAAYTDLSEAAFKGWRMLESASGRTILMPTRVLEAGPPGSKMVADSRAAALKDGVPGLTTGAEVNAAFPAFRLPEHWDVAVQESGGILLAEAAIRAFREGAEHRIIQSSAQIRPVAAGIRISTPKEVILAERAIIAAGPWIAGAGPGNRTTLKDHPANSWVVQAGQTRTGALR
ncbi:FAD-dependent oxidoreductase [Bradyrhizobium sp. CCGB01]|uniref:FAD-dependent oxidoreductase n=1 Tax=Bradyrhizobium sp. CCGB01 TaxID=2949634 RepID=UPI0035C6F383